MSAWGFTSIPGATFVLADQDLVDAINRTHPEMREQIVSEMVNTLADAEPEGTA